jgi:phosphoglycolate phosphatase-like HAD superfamily hydrolase
MVGDDSINDIQGAKQAGIITFQKVEKTIKTLDSDVVFDNFSDLCQYYVNLN